MTVAFDLIIPLANGLHARPATALRQFTRERPVTVTLVHRASGRQARSTDVLALVALDARRGDVCQVTVAGPDAAHHGAEVERWCRDQLPACDAASPAPAEGTMVRQGLVLPRLLAATGTRGWTGQPISPGWGEGAALHLGGGLPTALPAYQAQDATQETAAFRAACATVIDALQRDSRKATDPVERDLLAAHGALVEDDAWRQRVITAIVGGQGAAAAVLATARRDAEDLRSRGNPYLAARATDVVDLARQLLAHLPGGLPVPTSPVLTGPTILLAQDLTPSAFLALDRRWVRGLVLQAGAGTGHTAILARSFGIPAVVGVAVPVEDGTTLVVDGLRGLVVAEPAPAVARYYAQEVAGQAQRRQRDLLQAQAPATTRDGRTLLVEANISEGTEAQGAAAAGWDGIGLFRTEMLFLGRTSPPDEEEQLAAYARAAACGRPVTIRLLDVGGDKQLPWLDLPAEDNPFLGCRGVRLYARYPALIRTQVRAILRAAVVGDVRILIPMVAASHEIALVRDLMTSAAQELGAAGVPHRANLPLGIMVEVPVACLHLPVLLRQAQFVCVGTNDLAQYLFAADRGNPALRDPTREAHPAFLATLRRIVADAHAQGRPVIICGEMAGRRDLLTLLVGLGVDALSVGPQRVASLKADLAAITARSAEDLLAQAVTLPDGAAVLAAVAAAAPVERQPLLDRSLVLVDVEARTKEEALKHLVEHLHGLGRTDDPVALEDALWTREDAYSTGLGHGIAIPHGQCTALKASSLVVVRFRTPVAWQALDDLPVHTAFLLALRPAEGREAHLAVFARLARRTMDPDFRDQLARAITPDEFLTLLDRQVLRDLTPTTPPEVLP